MSMATIGVFLTQHSEIPRVEAVDEVRAGDRDVRQEAVIRTLIAIRKFNLDINIEDLALAFDEIDEEHRFASVALKWSYADARRDLHGRSRNGSRRWRTERIDGRTVSEQDMSLESGADRYSDDRVQRQFEAIESDTEAQLHALRSMSKDHAQAVELMLCLQNMKALGMVIPQAAHSALARLRRATGLPLNVTLL